MSTLSPKRIAILQSNYIPWKGYFDLVNSVDEFVLLDTVQFTKADWRNRNRIKTVHGVKWLTVPIQTKGRYLQRIEEARTVDAQWAEHHWRRLSDAYRKAPAFAEAAALLQPIYDTSPTLWLSEINEHFLRSLNRLLGISTKIRRDREFDLEQVDDKTQRLIEICKQAGASEYVSGPAAKVYLDEAAFRDQGIQVSWFSYPAYPEYKQIHPPFEHAVSVLDVIFHLGSAARDHVLPSRKTLPSDTV